MKPIILVSPPCKPPPLDEALRSLNSINPGEIDTVSIDSSWDSAPFFDHLYLCGYRPRNCREYDSLSLTVVKGSCGWHDDPGYGLVACWLLHNTFNFGFRPQLITRHGPLEVREDNVFVFNANQGHAWMSNGECVMLMATVAKRREVAP